jgi:hypothetical protein
MEVPSTPNMFSMDEYPPITSTSSSYYIDYFREQLVFFHFNLNRNDNRDISHELYNRFVNVLQSIKKCYYKNKNKTEYIHILDLYYRLLFYTRDIHEGKGERTTSYFLIMAFYDVYPTLAIHALHEFVRNTHKTIDMQSNDIWGSPAIGSWKDLFACCDFLREHSKKGDAHALIDICIDMVVLQLIRDNYTWKYSMHPMNPDYISNVAKWIPRENKKYNWMYEKLVRSWATCVHPHILCTPTTPDSQLKALSKCKRLFRKQISFLNKQLQTPEILMTQGKWDTIRRIHMPTETYMKHFEKLHTDTDIIYEKNNKNTHTLRTGSLPSCENLVKQAIRILYHGEPGDNNTVDLSRNDLNRMWKQTLSHIGRCDFQFTLPLLDVSSTMLQTDPAAFHSAIAIAMMIASRSSIESRILTVANSPTWIQWKHTDSFIDIVENILESISPTQGSLLQYETSINLIIQSLSGSQSTTRFIDNMQIVYISNFAMHMQFDDISHIFDRNLFDASPTIIYWNVARQNIADIDVSSSGHKHYYHSGNSIHALKTIMPSGGTMTMFETIANTLESTRYSGPSNYLYNLCKATSA